MRAPSFAPARWLLLAAAVAPVLLAWRVQKKHWINIPIWDEWDTPGMALLRFAEHNLSWADLFGQHNESRKVVPRLIHIAIASAAGWDVRQGMALTFLCAAAISVSALVYLRRPGTESPYHVLFAWLLINLFLFAPSQYENLLSGFTFEILIPFLCLLVCCGVNLSRWPFAAKVASNSFLALLSTYTFAHGMLLWAFAIPIPIRQERSRGRRFFLLGYAVYVVIGIISIAGYFGGYRRPEIFPPPANPAQIGQVLDFVLVWLGAVVRSPWVNAHVAGALVSLFLMAAVAGAVMVLRKNSERWPAYYPWLTLLVFSLASGVLTAIGRVNIGVESVFNTLFIGFSGMRYNLTSVFAWIAAIGLCFRLYQDGMHFQRALRSYARIALIVGCVLLAGAWIEMFADESARVNHFQANRRRARTAVIWSEAIPDNPEIILAYPYPDGFAHRVAEMRGAGLLKLPKPSDSLRQTISQAPTGAESSGGKLVLCERRGKDYYRFAGWARNPVANTVADYVILGWQGEDSSFHPFTAIATGLVRPDVAGTYGASSLKAGFDQEIEISKLPLPTVTIKAWAIDWNAQQAFPMEGALRITR